MWSTGINRNIVECKGHQDEAAHDNASVLIETLWNVKHSTRARAQGDTDVLIETLWNVKKITAHTNCEQVIPY